MLIIVFIVNFAVPFKCNADCGWCFVNGERIVSNGTVLICDNSFVARKVDKFFVILEPIITVFVKHYGSRSRDLVPIKSGRSAVRSVGFLHGNVHHTGDALEVIVNNRDSGNSVRIEICLVCRFVVIEGNGNLRRRRIYDKLVREHGARVHRHFLDWVARKVAQRLVNAEGVMRVRAKHNGRHSVRPRRLGRLNVIAVRVLCGDGEHFFLILKVVIAHRYGCRSSLGKVAVIQLHIVVVGKQHCRGGLVNSKRMGSLCAVRICDNGFVARKVFKVFGTLEFVITVFAKHYGSRSRDLVPDKRGRLTVLTVGLLHGDVHHIGAGFKVIVNNRDGGNSVRLKVFPVCRVVVVKGNGNLRRGVVNNKLIGTYRIAVFRDAFPSQNVCEPKGVGCVCGKFDGCRGFIFLHCPINGRRLHILALRVLGGDGNDAVRRHKVLYMIRYSRCSFRKILSVLGIIVGKSNNRSQNILIKHNAVGADVAVVAEVVRQLGIYHHMDVRVVDGNSSVVAAPCFFRYCVKVLNGPVDAFGLLVVNYILCFCKTRFKAFGGTVRRRNCEAAVGCK